MDDGHPERARGRSSRGEAPRHCSRAKTLRAPRRPRRALRRRAFRGRPLQRPSENTRVRLGRAAACAGSVAWIVMALFAVAETLLIELRYTRPMTQTMDDIEALADAFDAYHAAHHEH